MKSSCHRGRLKHAGFFMPPILVSEFPALLVPKIVHYIVLTVSGLGNEETSDRCGHLYVDRAEPML